MKTVEKWLPLFVAGVVICAYTSSFEGVFLLDDFSSILSNPDVQCMSSFSMSPRIIADITFKINNAMGNKLADYHAVNLLIHIGAALFMFGIVRRTCLLPGTQERFGGVASWLAAASAVIWGVHPLNTESVTYLCQRYESLMGLLILAALYCFERGCSTQRKRLWFDMSACFVLLGMGVKEVMIIAPAVIFLYDYVFVAGSLRAMRDRWKVHVVNAVSLLALIPLQMALLPQRMEAGYALGHGPLAPHEYLMTQLGVILHYIKFAFIPFPLCLGYAWPPARLELGTLAQGLVVAALVLFTVAFVRQRRPVGYLGAWFFVILLPTSSIHALADPMFEHRMYLPLMSIVILVVFTFWHLVKTAEEHGWKVPVRSVAAILAVAAIVIYGVMTYRRNNVYHSAESMWRDVVSKQQGNLRANNDLAVALSEEGKIREALEQYRKVLALIPVESREALESGKIKITGDFVKNSLEYNYFVAMANMGFLAFDRMNDDEMAMDCYRSALRVAPQNADVRRKMKRVMRRKGMAEHLMDAEIDKMIGAAVQK